MVGKSQKSLMLSCPLGLKAVDFLQWMSPSSFSSFFDTFHFLALAHPTKSSPQCIRRSCPMDWVSFSFISADFYGTWLCAQNLLKSLHKAVPRLAKKPRACGIPFCMLETFLLLYWSCLAAPQKPEHPFSISQSDWQKDVLLPGTRVSSFWARKAFFLQQIHPSCGKQRAICQLSYCELVLSYPVWRQIEIKRIFFMWLLNTCLLCINPFQRLSPVFLFYCMQTFEKYTKCFKALL